MAQLTYSKEEIARRGKEIYEKIRVQLESAENIGQIVAIDVNTGDYEIGKDILKISYQLKSRQPKAEMWAERIGFNAVYTVGGTLTRTSL